MARVLPPDGTVPLSSEQPTTLGVLPYRIVNGVVVLEVVVPVRNENGTAPIGYVLSRRVATNANTPDALNRLVGNGGRVLLGNQTGPVWTDLTRAVEAPPVDATTPGLRRYRASDGETRLVGISHLAGTPLAILVEFPEQLFVAPAWSLLRLLSLAGLLFTVLAVAVVWRLSARITRPLDELTTAVHHLSEGDFSRRVATHSNSAKRR
jgi:HAMP domain-containing protein